MSTASLKERRSQNTNASLFTHHWHHHQRFVIRSRHERTRLHGPIPNRLQDRATLLLPRSKRLEQLNDLIPLALSYVIDADHAHLDVIVEQKVEQDEEPLELVVVRPAWERAVGHEVGPHAFDRLCDPEELQSAADGTVRRDLECAR